MDPNQKEIAKDFPPFFKVDKDGIVHRYLHTDFVPPSQHPQNLVNSKDIIISPEPKLSARIYLPKSASFNNPTQKSPLLLYIHGGAFSIQSPFSSIYHTYLNNLVSLSEVVVVSVDYRLAPENPLPICYDDSWSVFNWVVSHSGKPEKPEPWLTDYVDFSRVFLGGDSAGANIAHDIMVRASSSLGKPQTDVIDCKPRHHESVGRGLVRGSSGDKDGIFAGVKLEGMILIHPFFGNGKKPDELWEYIYPGTSGLNDPRLNPAAHVDVLSNLGCRRILICIAEKDGLRKRGWSYYEAMKKSRWNGELEIVETKGQSHVFHLLDPSCEDAGVFMKQVSSFIRKTGLAAL